MDLDNIFTTIIQDTWRVYQWFAYNSVKAHHENFQYIILGNTGLHTLETGDITAKSVLLGIIIDSKLDFKEDINNIIKKKRIINYIP